MSLCYLHLDSHITWLPTESVVLWLAISNEPAILTKLSLAGGGWRVGGAGYHTVTLSPLESTI